MVLLRPKPTMLWLVGVVLIAHVSEAAGKPKLIEDGAACESMDSAALSLRSSKTSSPNGPEPGDPAAAFRVATLDGEFSYEPGAQRGSLIIHAFSNKSAFLECLWSSESSLSSLVEELPASSQVLFLSLDDSAVSDALWMREQLQRVAMRSNKEVLSRLHFSPVPVFALGNWIPNVLYYWRCMGRGCVFSQVVFKSKEWHMPIIVKRLDARYDWLSMRWDHRTYLLTDAGDGCEPSPSVGGALAWVSEGGCSFFTKVQSMTKSNASGVLVYTLPGNPIQDMNCVGDECDTTLAIPAAMVHLEVSVAQALQFGQPVFVSFQYTPSPNFFISIDHQGLLAEMGWFIYPSFSFINWQAQWFDFYADLQTKLQSPAKIISVFDKVLMQGEKGAVATVDLPLALSNFDKLELDASLSCPGRRDSTCAHWDHTVQLFCLLRSPWPALQHGARSMDHSLSQRYWALADRRVSSDPPAGRQQVYPHHEDGVVGDAWIASLNLRLSVSNKTDYRVETLRPFRVMALYNGGTFDKNYNKRFKPTEVHIRHQPKRWSYTPSSQLTATMTTTVENFASPPTTS
ncbi:hypothetical protein KUCAC02_014678 [Chaenocephalus aceratus]|uniref:Uncharacterized protein n=1 Tax=Chaenocephalus aceratus TaxID=36190 RepID=A0ACB9WEM2_CHAAC|nr:hypothetical protein KUCAC02_014678 [Chaenocephalus aceratus]